MSSKQATISIDDLLKIKAKYNESAFLQTGESEWGVVYTLNAVLKLIHERQ